MAEMTKPISIFNKKKKKDDENPVYKKKKRLFKYNRINRSLGGDLGLFLVLLIGAIFMAFPLYYTLGNSLKPLDELFLFPPNILPKTPTLKNYKDLFSIMQNSLVPMSKYIFNTVFLTFAATVLRVMSSSMCAYPLSKRKFKGSSFIFQIITLSLMFGGPANGTASFLIIANLGWLDSFAVILVPAMGQAFALYMVKQFIDQFPDTVIEAARIDGAGHFKIFWSILMPSIKPAWLTLIVFAVQEYWNMGASIYIYSEELKTLSYALSQITAVGIIRTGVSAAISVVMMSVPIAIFIITQSNILETMSTSGMKD